MTLVSVDINKQPISLPKCVNVVVGGTQGIPHQYRRVQSH